MSPGSLYQVNTRLWLREFRGTLGRPATLDDVSDAELDRLAALGFDWLWLLSVWQTGTESRRVSRSRTEWLQEFHETLPDLREEDICGSGFAVTAYTVAEQLGGDEALARFRTRLRQRGLRLLLDFVPNHMALDHPWVETHPDFFVNGSSAELTREPQNWCRLGCGGSERVFAYGRDPYFPGWPDTLQLDYGNPALQQAMTAELLRIAGQCDGVRCDMAMLVLPEVFARTWGKVAEPFWPRAIAAVKEQRPDFFFLAEAYWDLEWTLQQQGFDCTYDKRLYDRLRDRQAGPVRDHLRAGLDYQERLARFLENHDEPRAAATFPAEVHQAAAVITYLAPGLRFFHQGQFEGRQQRISPHLCRAPAEPVDVALATFYARLLAVLLRPELGQGDWQLLEAFPAWEGNGSCDAFILYGWQGGGGERCLVAVNYSGHPSQCYVRLPFPELGGAAWRLTDLLGDAVYDRDGSALVEQGLYLDVPAWHYHVFAVDRIG